MKTNNLSVDRSINNLSVNRTNNTNPEIATISKKLEQIKESDSANIAKYDSYDKTLDQLNTVLQQEPKILDKMPELGTQITELDSHLDSYLSKKSLFGFTISVAKENISHLDNCFKQISQSLINIENVDKVNNQPQEIFLSTITNLKTEFKPDITSEHQEALKNIEEVCNKNPEILNKITPELKNQIQDLNNTMAQYKEYKSENPGSDKKQQRFQKLIDDPLSQIATSISMMMMDAGQSIPEKLRMLVRSSQPIIEQNPDGVYIKQRYLKSCVILSTLIAASNNPNTVLPMVNRGLSETTLYFPDSNLHFNDNAIKKLKNFGIECGVNKFGIITHFKMSNAQYNQMLKSNDAATSSDDYHKSIVPVIEQIFIINDLFDPKDSGEEQLVAIHAILGFNLLYDYTANLLDTVDDLQSQSKDHGDFNLAVEAKVTPEVQKIINFLPQIKAKYPELLIEFSINGSRLSGKLEESHQVVFNRVRRIDGVPWVEYSNPHGYIEYMPLDQLNKNLSNISGEMIAHSITISAPTKTSFSMNKIPNTNTIKNTNTSNTGIIIDPQDINKKELMNNGKLIEGYFRTEDLMFYNGTPFSGFEEGTGVFYRNGRQAIPIIIKQDDLLYKEETRSGTLVLLTGPLEENYYYNGEIARASHDTDGNVVFGDKIFSGFDRDTNILYKNGKKVTGHVQIKNGSIYKYEDGIQKTVIDPTEMTTLEKEQVIKFKKPASVKFKD